MICSCGAIMVPAKYKGPPAKYGERCPVCGRVEIVCIRPYANPKLPPHDPDVAVTIELFGPHP